MNIWLELELVALLLVGLVVIVWVPVLALAYGRRNAPGKQPGPGILRIWATFAIVGAVLAVVAFLFLVLAPR